VAVLGHQAAGGTLTRLRPGRIGKGMGYRMGDSKEISVKRLLVLAALSAAVAILWLLGMSFVLTD
jgi:hypothetical protein